MPAEPAYTRPLALLRSRLVTRLEGSQALKGLRGKFRAQWTEEVARPGLFQVTVQEEPAAELLSKLMLESSTNKEDDELLTV